MFLRGWELTSNRTFCKFEDTTLCTNVPLLLVTLLCCSIPEQTPNLHEETVFEVFSFHPAESETLATRGRLSDASFRAWCFLQWWWQDPVSPDAVCPVFHSDGAVVRVLVSAVDHSRFVLLEALVCVD